MNMEGLNAQEDSSEPVNMKQMKPRSRGVVPTPVSNKEQRTIERIVQKQSLKENLLNFSKEKALRDINEINQLQSSRMRFSDPFSPAGREPSPLLIDSMLPVSAEIDRHGPEKTTAAKMPRFDSQSRVSVARRERQVSQREIYHKLNCAPEIEEDVFTRELRKMQEEKTLKEQVQRKAQRIQAQMLAARIKNSKTDEKFSFDYSGSKLTVRSENKNNLVSKLVEGTISIHTNKLKQALKDLNPTNIEDATALAKRKSPLNSTKRRDDVQFNDLRSLSESIVVGGGAKYTFEGKTIEGVVKSYSTVQLKKEMHQNRRLSKGEFERVKSLNGSMFNPEKSVIKTANVLFRQKSKSQAHLSKQSIESHKRERIIVVNQMEQFKLLEEMQELKQQPKLQRRVEKEKIVMGPTDIFNMNYLKSREQSNPSHRKDSESIHSTLFFPKIVHTNLSSHVLPKERERIKDSNLLIREVRKGFEDRLRT